jgi:hypothetical protein
MTKSLSEEMEEDAGVPLMPSGSELKSLAHLILRRDELLMQHTLLSANLSAINEELGEMERRVIPELMMAANLKKFTTTDGREVSYKMDYYGKADTPEAIKWLVDNGHGDIIKRDFKVALEKGDLTTAKKLREALAKLGLSYVDAEAVHSSTLKAWLREQIEGGASIPLETFKVHTEYSTKVKEKKRK